MNVSLRVEKGLTILAAFACLVLAVSAAPPTPVGPPSAPPTASPDGRLVSYFIGNGKGATGFRPSDRELAVWALEDWAKHSGNTIHLEPSPEEHALVRLYWAGGDGSLYGETRALSVDGRPGAAIYVTADVAALGPANASRAQQDPLWRDTIVYLTCLHELGHAFRLSHTPDERDIMYYFGYGGDITEYFNRYRRQLTNRTDIRSVSGLSQADIQRLLALRAGGG